MPEHRPVKLKLQRQPVTEGAGVRLNRLFGHAAMIGGRGRTGGIEIQNGDLVLYDSGDRLTVSAAEVPLRFLLLSGRPLNEPVAWRGPIVMNTSQELETAFQEYRNGGFIKT